MNDYSIYLNVEQLSFQKNWSENCLCAEIIYETKIAFMAFASAYHQSRSSQHHHHCHRKVAAESAFCIIVIITEQVLVTLVACLFKRCNFTC